MIWIEVKWVDMFQFFNFVKNNFNNFSRKLFEDIFMNKLKNCTKLYLFMIVCQVVYRWNKKVWANEVKIRSLTKSESSRKCNFRLKDGFQRSLSFWSFSLISMICFFWIYLKGYPSTIAYILDFCSNYYHPSFSSNLWSCFTVINESKIKISYFLLISKDYSYPYPIFTFSHSIFLSFCPNYPFCFYSSPK